MKVIGGIAEGYAYNQQGIYNQGAANTSAINTERDETAQESQLRQQVRQHIGSQVVAQGGSGFQMGTGSNVDALVESQTNGMLDALNLRRKAESQAQAYRVQGEIAKADARTKSTAAYIGAAQSLQEMAAQIAGGGGGG